MLSRTPQDPPHNFWRQTIQSSGPRESKSSCSCANLTWALWIVNWPPWRVIADKYSRTPPTWTTDVGQTRSFTSQIQLQGGGVLERTRSIKTPLKNRRGPSQRPAFLLGSLLLDPTGIVTTGSYWILLDRYYWILLGSLLLDPIGIVTTGSYWILLDRYYWILLGSLLLDPTGSLLLDRYYWILLDRYY
jgi:hypothetical protein